MGKLSKITRKLLNYKQTSVLLFLVICAALGSDNNEAICFNLKQGKPLDYGDAQKRIKELGS